MRYAGLVLASVLLLAGSAAASDVIQPPIPDGTVTTQLSAVTTTDGTTTTPEPVPAPQPAVPEPAAPAAPAPAVLPVPGAAMQALLLKQVRSKIVLTIKSAHHWQSLLGQKPLRPINIWALGSLQRANRVLATWKNRSHALHVHATRWMEQKTSFYKQQIRYWSRVMGVRPPRRTRALASSGSIEFQFNSWRRMSHKVWQQYRNPPQMGSFLCIHGHEGSWTDADSGGNGHYGGVQFGKHEWLTFGYPYTGKLWAYQATPLEQLWSAYRYYRVSGFNPWPQTARMCGLL